MNAIEEQIRQAEWIARSERFWFWDPERRLLWTGDSMLGSMAVLRADGRWGIRNAGFTLGKNGEPALFDEPAVAIRALGCIVNSGGD